MVICLDAFQDNIAASSLGYESCHRSASIGVLHLFLLSFCPTEGDIFFFQITQGLWLTGTQKGVWGDSPAKEAQLSRAGFEQEEELILGL